MTNHLLLRSRMEPEFIFWLLSSDDDQLEELTKWVEGGELMLSVDRLGGSGTLVLEDQGVDWMQHRVKILYDPGIVGVDPWPIGIYLFASPTVHRDGNRQWTEVGLSTKLTVIEEGSTVGTTQIAAGTNVVEAVVALIRSTGETRIAATPAQKVLAETYVADSTQSLLTTINDLLDSIGYWALSVDGQGQFVVAPYQRPEDRPVVWEFREDELSVIGSDQVDSRDDSSVPNQFVASTTGDDDTAPLVGVAQDTDPASPYSIQSRGRIIEARDTVEAVSQDDVDGIAARRLLALQSPTGKREVSHAMLPIRPRDAVSHRRWNILPRWFTVQKLSFGFGFDAQMSAEWNEVRR